MSLANYLKRAGVTTGPLKRMTRHSELSVLKSKLLGEEVSTGYKAHNNFGSALHHEFMIRTKHAFKLTDEEKMLVRAMIAALWANVIVKKLMERVICEKRLKFILEGVKMGGTPDIKQPHTLTISDLKTTVCATLKAFVAAAFKYGYYRQAVTYLRATGYKHYYIIGIQKAAPFNVYIVLVTTDRDRFSYAESELEFLLYFYKNYGTIK